MKSKTIILLGVALVCGLGAAWMTKNLLANRGGTKSEAKVYVLIAKKDLKTATHLEKPELYFEKKAFLKGQEPKAAITSFKKLKGKLLAQTLRKGDWVAEDNLWGQGEGAVEYRLPEGLQMFGLRVTLDRSASGFATLPGRHVDIYWIGHSTRDKKTMGGLLFQKVLVMSAGTKREANKEGQAMITPVVNVALKPDNIVLAKLAEQAGSLTFALRKPGDEKDYATLITADTIRKRLYGIIDDDNGDPEVTPTVVAQIPDVKDPIVKPVKPREKVKLPDGWEYYYATVVNGEERRKVLVIIDEKGKDVRGTAIYQKYAADLAAEENAKQSGVQIVPSPSPSAPQPEVQPQPAVTPPENDKATPSEDY